MERTADFMPVFEVHLTKLDLNSKVRFCSVQLSPLTDSFAGGDMRDSSAEIL